MLGLLRAEWRATRHLMTWETLPSRRDDELFID
jgi:hypothetical protein